MTEPVHVKWPVEVARLRVKPDIVGQTIPLGLHDGVAIGLTFPTAIDEDALGKPGTQNAAGKVTMSKAGAALVISYGTLTVEADLSTEMGHLATVGGNYSPTPAEEEAVKSLRRQALGAARLLFGRFIELLAVSEKRFVITIERPPLIQLGYMTVGPAQNHIPWGHDPLLVTAWGGSDAIPTNRIYEMANRAAAGERASLPWLLYREAFNRLVLEDDPRPSVVEAATSVEVGIKSGLREKRPSPMVDLLTDTTRVEMLLKEGAAAVVGQSFAAADQVSYAKVDALLKQRHALVHGGQEPDAAALKDQLPAIRALLDWIDQQ
jgi:hypothetical protein